MGWQVEIEGAALRTSTGFELEVQSGIDWFDLEAEVSFGGQQSELTFISVFTEARRYLRTAVTTADDNNTFVAHLNSLRLMLVTCGHKALATG